MDLPVIAGLLALLAVGIGLFARAYFGGMRFGDRLEQRRAAEAAQGPAGGDSAVETPPGAGQ